MSNSAGIHRELDHFQRSVTQLSSGVGSASVLWKDEKFTALSAAIGTIASQSKEVLVMGDRCCSSLEAFSRLSQQNVY